MYNEYFGFKESPFSIAPDPRYLYMTAQHRDALAHLVYGLNSEGGCILLTGEVGTGKTTICRCLLEQIPDQTNVALVLNPKVSEIELLETICDELKIDYPDGDNSLKIYTDRIYNFLITRNRDDEKTILIIDEAQNLDSKVLEQLRLLTNLETDKRKLLQIIILGQPELLEILARSDMRQLAQRITARFHLQPLTRPEVKAYVSHRLAVAGQNIQLFPEKSIKLLYRLSNGIPRLINVICDRALLGAYVENQYAVNPATLKKAATEVFGELKNVETHQKNKQWLYTIAISTAVVASVLFITLAVMYYSYDTDADKNVNATNQPSTIIDSSTPSNTAIEPDDSETLVENADSNLETEPPPILKQRITAESSPTIKDRATITTVEHDDVGSILDQSENDPASAYQELFNAWGQQYNKKTSITACKQAQKHSLSCLHKQGNLNSLKAHNRPAVLTLINKQGKTRYVTLSSINDKTATIYFNNTAYTVKLNALDRFWYGQYIILWHKPKHYLRAITPGDSGDIVSWLNSKLEKINADTTGTVVNTYSQHLLDKVIVFQEKFNLTADGIVGPITIIHLNTQSGMNVPSLTNSTATPAQSFLSERG